MSFSGWFTTYPSQLSVMALFMSPHIKKTINLDDDPFDWQVTGLTQLWSRPAAGITTLPIPAYWWKTNIILGKIFCMHTQHLTYRQNSVHSQMSTLTSVKDKIQYMQISLQNICFQFQLSAEISSFTQTTHQQTDKSAYKAAEAAYR